MSEPTKIEPYYRHQGKQLVDCLFDKGLLSESLSRDGMDNIEELLALYLQMGAQSAAKCAEIGKEYKATRGRQEGEDQPRHEEEMRWIARAREAEARVRKLEQILDRISEWTLEVGALLKESLSPPYLWNMGEAARLLADAFEKEIIPEPLGFTAARCADRPTGAPEPDCRPGQTLNIHPDVCSHSEKPHPGALLVKCSVCGGAKTTC